MNKVHDHEAFVRLWMKAYKKGLPSRWVAEQMGFSPQRAAQLKIYLAMNGVELPKLYRTNAQTHRRQLNKIIDDAMKEDEQ